ncbi:MAG: recombinase family protein [Eubacteriales bacterium]|nr:recombinase family protein [Eubacteriales bacterium]
MLKSTENTNNLITALYCRLSVEDKKDKNGKQRRNIDESNSISNQKMILQRYADDHGFYNCKFYIDDGYTGTNFDRPAFKQMDADMRAGKIGVIIVKDQSRLGREHIKTNHLMEIVFHTYNVRFIAINDGYDSLNIKDMDFSGIRNYFNDFYAADTSKKIRAVQKAKGERGEHLGTAVPYGYLKNPEYKGSQKEHPYLIINPETAPVVKRIFELYAGGTGIRKICAILEREQIMSPSVYAFKRTGNRSGHPDLNNPFRWTQTTVRGMLGNQEYCGDTVNFKTYSKSNKLKKRLKNDAENIMVFENTHEAIVSRGLFDAVQKHFEGRKRPDQQGEMDKYAGYLFCGECGQKLYLHRCKSLAPEKNFFQCGGYQTKGGTHCSAHYIREQMLDEIVLGRVQKMTALARENPEEFYAMATENGEAEAKKFYAMAERQRNSLESRVKEIDKIIRCLYEDRVVGRITPERYDELACGYELEQTEIKQELESITARIAEMDMRDICVREFIENAKEIVDMDKLTPKILRAFVLRIDVYEKAEKFSRKCGNYIEVHYTFQPKPRTTSKTAVSTIAVLPIELQMAAINA